MTLQRQSTPAQPSVISTDTPHGNAQAKVLADKANAALEHLISPAITPKLSELPTVEARLMALADAIERQELVKQGIGFNMAIWYGKANEAKSQRQDRTQNSCGTVACLAGWTALLNGDDVHPDNSDDVFRAWHADSAISSRAMKILGLNRVTATALFQPADGGGYTDGSSYAPITTQRAIAVVRNLAKTGKVQWGNFDNKGNPK